MTKVSILGVDPGTANTGYSLLVGNLQEQNVQLHDFGMWKTKKSEDFSVRDRIDYLAAQYTGFIKSGEVTHIAIEDFTEQGKLVGKTYKEMSWLVEHLRIAGRTLGIPTYVYENAEWKRILLRARQANKNQVMHYVRIHVPGAADRLPGQPNHVWDSVAIGYCLFKQLCVRARILQ